MTKNSILITGGSGFAGSHLVEHLLENGVNPEEIHVTTFSNKQSFLHQLLPKESIHQVDLTDAKETASLFEKLKPNQVYHLASSAAAGSSFGNLRKTIQNNLDLQLNILTSILEHCPKARVLNVGSALEYDTSHNNLLDEQAPLGPSNPYAVSKVIQEMLAISFAKSNNLEIVFVRPFNHIGERQSTGFVVSDFCQQIARIEQGLQEKISVGNLSTIRDFTDVKDIVRGYTLLMKNGQKNQIYNLGSGKGISIQQILDYLIKISDTDISVEVDRNKYRPVDVKSVIANNQKVRQLGWSPTFNLAETLTRTLQWWRENL